MEPGDHGRGLLAVEVPSLESHILDADDFFKTVWYNGTSSVCTTMAGHAPNIYFYACECNFGFLCLPVPFSRVLSCSL